MSKTLPIDLDPPIKAYTTHAFYLSIASQHKDFLPWFSSNFIQLMCFRDFSISPYTPVNFYLGTVAWDFNLYRGLPLVDSEVVSRSTLDGMIGLDIVEFLKKGIDANKYGYLHVNDYYIPGRPDRQFTHEILVYGYDETTQTLEAVTYYGSFYGTRSIPYDDFRKAYESLLPEPRFQSIYLLSVSGNEFKRVDARLIRHECQSFLQDSTQDVEAVIGKVRNPRELQVFGKQIYSYMRANAARYASRDVRPIHLLWEHKKCMQLRLDYFKELGLISAHDASEISRGFEEIGNQLQALRNMQLKNRVREDAELENKLIQILSDVEAQEIELFEKLLAALESATLPVDDYLRRVLANSDMTLENIARLSGTELEVLQRLLDQELFPWEFGYAKLRNLADALGIQRALLEQLIYNDPIEPTLRRNLASQNEVAVSRTVAEHDNMRFKLLAEIAAG